MTINLIIHTNIQSPDSGKLTHSDGVFMKGGWKESKKQGKGAERREVETL